MQEAQDLFGIEFDALPQPVLDFAHNASDQVWRVDLDQTITAPPPAGRRAQAFTLWLRSAHFSRCTQEAANLISQLLEANPFTTLQVVLEPTGELTAAAVQRQIGPRLLGRLLAVCQAQPTYLDKFYALQPGRPNGAKRLLVLLPLGLREYVTPDWIDAGGETATLVWRGPVTEESNADRLAPHETLWSGLGASVSGGGQGRESTTL
jgi:hypothetical protein